jgi:hypothetical protein
MAIVVVGGQSRNLGKTSVMTAIIATLPALNWTAFKLTQFGHGRCSLDGKPCHCATDDHCYAISEELDRVGGSDTSRFLAAGAKRSFWVRTEQGRLVEALPAIQRRLADAENAILESNSILHFIQPDLYITVLDPAIADFKASARTFLGRADAVVLHSSSVGNPSEEESRIPVMTARRVFRISPPDYASEDLIEFVRNRLESALARSQRASPASS